MASPEKKQNQDILRVITNVLTAGDRILVAVSGGPDSLCLLHALHFLQSTLPLGGLFAAHLDHGLRGEESAAEARFVAEFCAEREIPCRVGAADVPALQKAQGGSKQEAARRARYAFLEERAREFSANKIATGHTQDDQTETILLHILRGSGLEGLKGIPKQRGPFIRPLLDISREEIEAYCATHQLMPRRDPSNADSENYTRNRIRLRLLPELERDYNLNVREALLRLSQIAARDQDYLAGEARAVLPRLTHDEAPERLALDRHGMASLHPALQGHVLRHAIAQTRGTLEGVTYEHLENVRQKISRPEDLGSLTLPHPALIVQITVDQIIFQIPASSAPEASVFFYPLTLPGQIVISETGWTVECGREALPAAKHGAVLDMNQIETGSLAVRNWRPGDRMAILGMDGRSKKVQDLFTDAKLPKSERHSMPIITDATGILWIPGVAVAERAKTTPHTAQRLYLTASQSQEKAE